MCQRMLNDVNNYTECCKTTKPSIYSSEIQNKLVKNSFQCLPKNRLSPASISCSVIQDLGLYSFKKFSVIQQESQTLENENILFQYLAAFMGNAFL